MVMFPKFQDALVALPTVIALDAVLPKDVESLPGPVYDALRSDNVKGALRAGKEWREEAGEEELIPRVALALLLEGCDRLDDALETVAAAREDFDAPELVVVEAEIRLERGEMERAEQLLDAFHERYGDDATVDADLWGFAADLYLDVGREEAAIEAYERAVDGGTEKYETVIRLAKLRQDRERWADAAALFERAAELGGDVVGPWDEAAESWERAGELRRSLQAREEVLEQRTGDAETWARQGIGYRRLGELDRAAEALEKATRFAPERPAYWIERAETLEQMGLPERAIECYREVLDVDPDYLEAHLGVVSSSLAMGDPKRAEEAARRAVDAEDASPEAQLALGRALRARNETDGAIEALRRAVELDGQAPEYQRELGEALVDRGDVDAGLEHLERTVEQGAGEGEPTLILAEILLREEKYDPLRDRIDRSGTEAGGRWALVRPIYGAVIAGIDEDESRRERSRKRFEAALEEHGHRIPVAYDFDEIERFGTVLDRCDAKVVEAMIAILEGRASRDALDG